MADGYTVLFAGIVVLAASIFVSHPAVNLLVILIGAVLIAGGAYITIVRDHHGSSSHH